MERKNTMLLTVIAIATLLVAVVGATFAYFTATIESDGNTVVTVQTEAVSITTAGYSDASIIVSGAEMSAYVSLDDAVTYRAEDTSSDADADGYAEIVLTHTSLTSDYVCTYDLVYTGSTYEGKTDDISLIITPESTGGTSSLVDEEDLAIEEMEFSFAELTETTKLVDGATFTISAGDSEGTLKFGVALQIVNSQEDQTEDLADQVISGVVKFDELNCVAVEPSN